MNLVTEKPLVTTPLLKTWIVRTQLETFQRSIYVKSLWLHHVVTCLDMAVASFVLVLLPTKTSTSRMHDLDIACFFWPAQKIFDRCDDKIILKYHFNIMKHDHIAISCCLETPQATGTIGICLVFFDKHHIRICSLNFCEISCRYRAI
jgi:hypothetical protein